MRDLLWFVPLMPLLGAVSLILFGRMLPRALTAMIGVGSVGIAAVLVAAIGLDFNGQASTVVL